MFGGAAFGEFAFGEFDSDIAASVDAYLDWLRRPAAARCWLLEVDALSLAAVDAQGAGFGDAGFGEIAFAESSEGIAGGEVTQYWSTHGYTSQAGDVPARTWYAGRLQADQLRLERAIAGERGIGGLARVYAEAILVNDDGGLDALNDAYALDGRAARVYLGAPDAAKASYGLVFSGVVRTVTVGNTVRLGLSDGLARLEERMVNPSTYAGSGGTEGGDDLKGKRKPWCGGTVKNVPAVLVDAANLIYQVSDGAIQDVPAVYDRGIALTKVGGAPGAGQYSVDTTNGRFTLGATPAGTVTADVEGDATLDGYIEATGALVRRILLVRGGIASGEIEPVSFDRFASAVPAAVGIWVGTEPVSCAAAIDELLANVGAFGGFTAGGQFSIARLDLPTGAPAASYDTQEIGEIERAPLPAAVDPVAWRISVGWQRNYTVQTDLAAAVSDAQRVFVAEAVRAAVDEDATVKSQRRLAVEYGPGPGLYAAEADAETEAARLAALWSVPRKRLRVPLPLQALVVDLGDVVRLTHPRHGLANGRDGRVLGTQLTAGAVELEVLV